MTKKTYAIIYPPGKPPEVRGPLTGNIEEKVNKVYAHYLLQGKINKAPSIALVETEDTKEELEEQLLEGLSKL